MTKKCAYCGAEFEPKRSTAKFCSDAHRVMSFLKKESGREVAAVKVVQKSDNEILGEKVADFCNKNNCTWDDLVAAYSPASKSTKIAATKKVEEKPKAASGFYDRRASKLGF